MKEIIISSALITFALLLNSCGTLLGTYYDYIQILKTNPVNNHENLSIGNGGILYEDGYCQLFYKFWEDGGNAGFAFYNKTDEIIYLDLSKTFFVKNGIAYDYYNPELFVSIVAIPPKASKFIKDFSILHSEFVSCELKYYPDQPDRIVFTEEDSPLTFSNYITFKVGETSQPQTIENKFYVCEITNYVEQDVINFIKRDKSCENILTPTEIRAQKNNPDIYDAVITVFAENAFYKKYQVFSSSKLYKRKYSGYFWNSLYDGYVKGEIQNTYIVPKKSSKSE